MLVFVTGGGSRGDIQSLAILRPACAFFAAYALTVATGAEIARVRVPLLLLLALAGWMAIQLVPLPPGLWALLPGRAAIAAIDRLAGMEGVWRPISLSPSKTINALGSLVVPAAALLLYAILTEDARRRIPALLLAAAAASALLGIAQIASGAESPFYLYAITNPGTPVGLFSNRNHNAVFLGSMLVMVAYLMVELRHRGARRGPYPMLLLAAAALLLVVTLLVSGSRAGLLVGVLAIGFGFAFHAVATLAGGSDESRDGARSRRYFAFASLGIAALAGLALLFYQSASIDRLVRLSVSDELRVQAFPQIVGMARDHWLFGIGFGAFEHVFRGYETSALLRENYLNNAHDDWLQWIIEGGLPAALIALAFAVWMGRACLGHWRVRAAAAARARLIVCSVVALLLLLLASALDYPLRVPSMMLYAALLTAIVAYPPEKASRGAHRGAVRKG
ncbi:MAG: O-antigen ligase family protein [Sphingomonas sp.]